MFSDWSCEIKLQKGDLTFRYKAIVWPLKVRTSKMVVTATILFIWIGSTVFALPALLFSTT